MYLFTVLFVANDSYKYRYLVHIFTIILLQMIAIDIKNITY